MPLELIDIAPCPECKATTPTYRQSTSTASILRGALLLVVLPAAALAGLRAAGAPADVVLLNLACAAPAAYFFYWLATSFEPGNHAVPICGGCGAMKRKEPPPAA